MNMENYIYIFMYITNYLANVMYYFMVVSILLDVQSVASMVCVYDASKVLVRCISSVPHIHISVD